MKRAVAGLAALIVASPCFAQSAQRAVAAPKPAGKCEALARDWKAIEFEMADNYAAGVTDDSAPRATMRAAQDQVSLLRAEITLQLMRDFRCPLPSRAPSRMTYSLDAMKCRTEQLKGNSKAPECDYSTWTPLGG